MNFQVFIILEAKFHFNSLIIILVCANVIKAFVNLQSQNLLYFGIVTIKFL